MKQRHCKVFHILFLHILFVFIGSYGYAQSRAIETPRIGPSETAIQLAAEAVPLSPRSLIDFSLLFSEVSENRLDRYHRRIEELIDALEGYPPLVHNEMPSGDAVLDFMHTYATKTYNEDQTRLDVLLEHGSYNCVSSSILYTILARSIGLSVGMVSTSDHVFCVVRSEEGSVDVETTNEYGYNPGEKKKFFDKFGRTGYTYVPPGNYRLRNETDDKGLIAFILQNRIAELERKNEYHKAVELAVDRNTVLDTTESYNSMVKEFINYAAWLNRDGAYLTALGFVSRVKNRYGEGGRYDEIEEILINNRMTVLVKAQRFDEAFEFIRKMHKTSVIDGRKHERLFHKIEDQRLFVVTRNLPFKEAVVEVKKSFSEGDLTEERYREYIEYLYLKEAEKAVEKEGWLAGLPIVTEAQELMPGSSKLAEAKEAFTYNYIVGIHNTFASLFNNKRYEKAAELLEEALAKFPSSKTLVRDKRILDRALEQVQ